MEIIFYNNLIYKLTKQFSVEAVKEIRTLGYRSYELPCKLLGIAALSFQQTLFLKLQLSELFGQLIGFRYENVRINAAAFFQSGQQLILTGKFRYLLVQLNDVHAPEEFPFTDGLEVNDEVGQNVAASTMV